MASRISNLVLGCRDPEALARFWCEVLGFVVIARADDGSVGIGPSGGFGGPQPTMFLSRRAEPEKGRSRLHIDVNATDRDQDAELERLLKLGARRPTSARQARRSGMSWPTPRATSSACSRDASTHSKPTVSVVDISCSVIGVAVQDRAATLFGLGRPADGAPPPRSRAITALVAVVNGYLCLETLLAAVEADGAWPVGWRLGISGVFGLASGSAVFRAARPHPPRQGGRTAS